MSDLVFRDDSYARSCVARVVATDARGIRLDRTVFYPTGGGQPGDTGVLRLSSGATIAIADTIKGEGTNEVIHIPAPGSALPEPGAEVTAEIDWERRHRLMRMHTCLHLLCAVVPGAARLNELIASGYAVAPRWIGDDELAVRPELVRTMSVKPPTGAGRVRLIQISGPAGAIDLQPCGGTHIRNTAEIGPVEISKIESKGRQNRRIILRFLA
jgi:misacylated tRNA(Ala) deacylase